MSDGPLFGSSCPVHQLPGHAIGELRSDDTAVRAEAEKRERALLYVAITRARREVLITSHSHGEPSPFL